MDNTTQPTNQMPPVVNKPPVTPILENQSSIGGIIGIIIIIAIIILGGLYFWGKRVEEVKNEQAITKEMNTGQQANVVHSTTSSNSIDSISTDLNSTQTTNLDSELH